MTTLSARPLNCSLQVLSHVMLHGECATRGSGGLERGVFKTQIQSGFLFRISYSTPKPALLNYTTLAHIIFKDTNPCTCTESDRSFTLVRLCLSISMYPCLQPNVAKVSPAEVKISQNLSSQPGMQFLLLNCWGGWHTDNSGGGCGWHTVLQWGKEVANFKISNHKKI